MRSSNVLFVEAVMFTRSKTFFVVGALTGAALLTGCPGKKDEQELKPLAELKAEHAQERARGEEPSHEPALSGSGEATSAESPTEDATLHSDYTATAHSTGTAGWREPSGGRHVGQDMTFGSGSSAGTQRWAFNTDTTGAAGDQLGIGQSYGASSGKLEVVPGKPQTRPDNYPTVQGAAPAHAAPAAGAKKPAAAAPAQKGPAAPAQKTPAPAAPPKAK